MQALAAATAVALTILAIVALTIITVDFFRHERRRKREAGLFAAFAEMRSGEYRRARDRVKTALDRYLPGLGAEAGQMPGASVRALVNEITGAAIPNGDLLPTMTAFAVALERCNSDKSHRVPAKHFAARFPALFA